MERKEKRFKSCIYMCIGLFIATMQTMAQTDVDTGKVVLSAWGSHETGQMYNIRWQGNDIPRQWLMREQANLTANYIYNEYFRGVIGMTGRMWFETYPDNFRNPANSPRKPYYTVYPSAAEGIFSFNSWNTAKLGLEVGYFPFKYNPDTRNLGEYLIRCGAYPPYIVTNLRPDFESFGWSACKRDIMGHASCTYFIYAGMRYALFLRSVAHVSWRREYQKDI